MIYFLTGLTAIFLLTNATPAEAIEAAPATTQSITLQTVTLDVPGMTCVTCPYTVRKSLEFLAGVKEVKASFDTKTATVTFDPTKTSVQKFIAATTNVGYVSTLKKGI